MGGAPSLWTNPDWYESMLAVTIALLTLVGWLVKAFIVNPIKTSTKESNKSLAKIDDEVSKVSSELKGMRIAAEQTNESLKSAHKRIDGTEERVKRLEDRFLFDHMRGAR